jgi:hypothetical protein
MNRSNNDQSNQQDPLDRPITLNIPNNVEELRHVIDRLQQLTVQIERRQERERRQLEELRRQRNNGREE